MRYTLQGDESHVSMKMSELTYNCGWTPVVEDTTGKVVIARNYTGAMGWGQDVIDTHGFHGHPYLRLVVKHSGDAGEIAEAVRALADPEAYRVVWMRGDRELPDSFRPCLERNATATEAEMDRLRIWPCYERIR